MRRAMQSGRRLLPAAVPAVILAALLFAPPPVWAQAEGPVSPKLARKISVMEKVMNEILRESPNWLVGGGGDYTRSLYLEEFGVIFSFDASLVERFGRGDILSFDGIEWLSRLDKIRVETEGDKVVVYSEDESEGESEAEEEKLSLEELRAKRQEREQRRYEAGKQEMIDALLDYGDTLTDLNNQQNVALVAYLQNADLFEREELSRLIVRAKVSDLRAMGDGKLSRDEMIKRLRVEEY